jgi:CheY-like chemotaxis protein/HAMP domain-containing protein
VTFKAKLLFIVGTALAALVLVIVGSLVIGRSQAQRLVDLEDRLVPKLTIGPQVEGEFDRLGRAMQDAVSAQDSAALDATLGLKMHLVDAVTSVGAVLEARDASELRWSIQNYYDMAQQVSRRLLAGETGESLAQDIAQMQERQRSAATIIRRVTSLDRRELTDGFAAVRSANRSADDFRLRMGVGGLVVVAALSLWVARGMVRSLGQLSTGFARFATGDFSQLIAVTAEDEVGKVAGDANHMAQSLKRLGEQRDRNDWLKAGLVGLSDQLRGELEPAILARRSLAYVVPRIEAVAGALYLASDDGGFQLLARDGFAAGAGDTAAAFAAGEGLLARAATGTELLVVENAPRQYLQIRSGLGEAGASTLLFLPLRRAGRIVAVLELAMFRTCTSEAREWLTSIGEMLVGALEAARSDAALRELLDRTQRLAERLTAQEEELRLNNQELQVQQEELRQANEELEMQRHTLAQKNGEVEEARRREQQKNEELGKVSSYKSQFLANMSHELRTPLNSMLLLSHLLGENDGRNLSQKQVDYAKTIHSAGQDLLGLINQVLDLSKIEAGKQELDLESTPLEQFAEFVRRIFGPVAANRGLELVTEIAPAAPATIVTDRLRVERILTNLVGNAIKFTEQGSIALVIGRPPAGVRFQRADLAPATAVAFAVTDTGIGIAPESQERAFAPFEQIETQNVRRFAGTGLGLTIARESAGLLGGELQLVSAPGKGSTFTCFLPERAAEAKAPSDAAPRAKVNAPPTVDDRTSLRPSDAHLLVIEDDPVLGEQLIEVIRARGLKAVLASTGEEGLALAKERRPQGILLDVKLPTIDGWTVMRLLQQDPATQKIPVHFVSGVDAPERGLALGAVGYLTKPTTHAELAAAVRTLAPSSSTDAPRVLVVEDSDAESVSVIALLDKEGLEAHRVRNAADALAALEREPYGCIILDLGLPDMDGLGLLETLSGRTDFAMPKVLVHTARALTRKETQKLQAYAEAVILKDGSSEERLGEEIRLFVRHVKERLPAEKQTRPVEQPASAEVSLHGVKLLVAEDDMRTVYALSALLRGKGADVVVADNGREALEMLSRNPDVRGVLMDIMMPEMDGYEAMRRLRQRPEFARLPVIALTAKAMKGERERCLEAGANDYLTKPVDSKRLLTTLQGWLFAHGNDGLGK